MSVGNEFLDLMPHTISVVGNGTKNDYGRITYDETTRREYRCLLDVSEITTRTADGTNVSVSLTAYVRSTPTGAAAPLVIQEDEQVTVVTPPELAGVRPLVSVASHYDESGLLHNQTLRFS